MPEGAKPQGIAKKPRQKGELRDMNIGIKITGHPEVKKEHISVVYLTRDTDTVVTAIEADRDIINLRKKLS